EEIFFLQAEDGIRVRNVTGVQTCALPISPPLPSQRLARRRDAVHRWSRRARQSGVPANSRPQPLSSWGLRTGISKRLLVRSGMRSEERRVGKECRSGWWSDL